MVLKNDLVTSRPCAALRIVYPHYNNVVIMLQHAVIWLSFTTCNMFRLEPFNVMVVL